MRRRFIRFSLLVALAAMPAAVRASHSDLAAEWTFAEPDGSVALDTSGHANDGTLVRVQRVGERGGAILFPSLPAPPAWVAVPAPSGSTLYEFDTGLTVEAFVKPDVLPPEGLVPLGRIRYIVWGDDDVFGLQLRADDPEQAVLRGIINCGRSMAGVPDVEASAPFPHDRAGVFTHVALTFADGTLRLYVDGMPVAEAQDTGDPPCGSRAGPVGFRELVQIGGDETTQLDPDTLRTFRGVIDDVRIWRRALSPEEIAAAAAGPPCESDADCDDGDPCTVDACDPQAACSQTPLAGIEWARCQVERVRAPAVCENELVRRAERLRRKLTRKVLRFLKRLERGPSAAKVEKLLTRADRKLARLDEKLATGKLAEKVDAACRTRLQDLIGEARDAIASLRE